MDWERTTTLLAMHNEEAAAAVAAAAAPTGEPETAGAVRTETPTNSDGYVMI